MRRRAGIVSKEEQEAQAQAERLGKGPVQAPSICLDYFTEDLIYDPEAGRFDPPPSGRPQAHTVVPTVAASTVFGHPIRCALHARFDAAATRRAGEGPDP